MPQLWQRINQRVRENYRRVEFWIALAMLGVVFAKFLGNVLLGQFFFFELFSHFQVQYQYFGWALLVVWVGYRAGRRRKLHIWPHLASFWFLGLGGPFNSTGFRDWTPGEVDLPLTENYADIRVFHANVLYTRAEYSSTIALIRQARPDLYVLQEMTPASIGQVVPQLRPAFPYWFACWSKGPCWILVGSRTPFWVGKSLARQKRIIALDTRVRNRAMSLITVHPRTPILPSWFDERNEQLQFAARKARTNARPTVLIGDFNMSIFAPLYKTTFEYPDHGSPGTYSDNARWLTACRKGFTQPTWPRFFWPMLIPIDHAFVNRDFRPVRFRTLDQPGSDHRAIVADINFVKRFDVSTTPSTLRTE